MVWYVAFEKVFSIISEVHTWSVFMKNNLKGFFKAYIYKFAKFYKLW